MKAEAFAETLLFSVVVTGMAHEKQFVQLHN